MCEKDKGVIGMGKQIDICVYMCHPISLCVCACGIILVLKCALILGIMVIPWRDNIGQGIRSRGGDIETP